ncbi:FAD-binding oxidoreductase [Cellulosimicrobium terreum]|nr:FAD-binding oxidoreductase [Cellulosimicrobium terreum]
MVIPGPGWHRLQTAVRGHVVLDPEPTAFNARFHDVRARATVRCTSPEDVAATLSFVREHDLGFAVRSGGHCFAGHSSSPGVVLDVTPLDTVVPDGELARIGAGARLGAVYDRLQEGGRTLPAGTCPGVGIAGLALGGGLGVLGRRHGLVSDRMVSAQVVLADGTVVTCDETREEDLFWALRGAGSGGFGVVTSFVFRSVPAPRSLAFHLAWDVDQAADVVAAWQTWAPTGPDELAASLKLVATGDPAAPPAVNVYGVVQVGAADGSELVADLRDRVGTEPTWSWSEVLPFARTRRMWEQLPPSGTPFHTLGRGAEVHPWLVARSEFFREPLPSGTVEALLESFTQGRVRGEERELDLMPWGGAYNRVATDATAFVHRDAMFQLKHSATVRPDAPAGAKDTAHAFVRRSWETVHPWGSGGVFPAFPDPDLPDPVGAYHGSNLPRLRTVKARYDPANVFRSPAGQGIVPG